MKSTATSAKSFKALLKRLAGAEAPPPPAAADPMHVLVMSFLLWEATTEKAASAFRRLTDTSADFNDLRVSMPREIVELIGDRYPAAADRAQRLRAALRDIYLREHDVNLERLRKMGKRDVRKYLETLDGIAPYVSARVLLLCFDTHVIPVDEQLRRQLVAAGVAGPDVSLDDLSAWLSRQVKAEEGVRVHGELQAWVDHGPKRTTTGRKAAKTEAPGETTTRTNRARAATRRGRPTSSLFTRGRPCKGTR